MKFFIASSWSNMKQVQYLTENLLSLGHQVFSHVKDSRNFVPTNELKKPDDLFAGGDDWRKRDELRKIFEHDLTGLEESDVFIMLLPAGKTSHIAAGIAYGFGKHLILIGNLDYAESHYFVFDADFKTIEDYISTLKK